MPAVSSFSRNSLTALPLKRHTDVAFYAVGQDKFREAAKVRTPEKQPHVGTPRPTFYVEARLVLLVYMGSILLFVPQVEVPTNTQTGD